MGVGFVLYAFAGSYAALLAVSIVASFGFHMWTPLHSAIGMSLSTKENAGRVLGTLASVGSLAAIAGMGALFAATVRAPVTGIILVIEMTDNYLLILPLIITCLGATMVAQALGGHPIYSQILQRTLRLSLRKKRREKMDEALTKLEKGIRS